MGNSQSTLVNSSSDLSNTGIRNKLRSLNCDEIKFESDTIQLAGRHDTANSKVSVHTPQPETETSTAAGNNAEPSLISSGLFRLFVKNGEYVYARPNDIIMMESCDHLVKVYLGINDKLKLTVRPDTLKNFLSQLPESQFMRFGRFCAVNIHRLSGGNYNAQMFEFDFKISIKLKHCIPHTVFTRIGN